MTTRLAAWGPAVLWAAVLFFLSAQPDVDRPFLLFEGGDKVIHVGVYAVLGATLAWGRFRATAAPSSGTLVVLGILYGARDEWHQSFVAGRDSSAGDWAADTVGVLLGYWVASMIIRHGARMDAALRPHKTDPGP